MSAITWVNLSKATASGSSITKTSGFDDVPDGGGVSLQSMAGDGTISITPPAASDSAFGLSPDSTLDTFAALPFAFRFPTPGAWEVRELGVYRTDGTYNDGDVFTIARSGTTVTYKKNGSTVLTSPGSSSGAVYAQAVIFDVNASLNNGDMTGGGTGTIPTLGSTTPTTQTSAPISYPNAVDTRTSYARPALPSPFPAAGSSYQEPAFGRHVWRLTDANTASGKSFHPPSSEELCIWSRDNSELYLVREDGTVVCFSFNRAAKTITPIRNTTFSNEPTYSRVTAKVMYGAVGYLIKKHDTNANTYTTLLDLTSVDPAYTGGSFVMGGTVQSSASSPERIVCFYGGTGQDTHFRVMIFEAQDITKRLILDTQAKTINGVAVPIDTTFFIHAIGLDQTGRYVILYTAGGSNHSTRSQFYVWDVQTGVITSMVDSTFPFGHVANGYGMSINNDGSSNSPFEAMQWQRRSLADPTHPTRVLAVTDQPPMVYEADHPQYTNARSDADVPFLTLTYPFYENIADNIGPTKLNNVAYRAIDGIVVAIHPVTGARYPFCYHFANIYADDGSGSTGSFWYQPQGHISPDGLTIVFGSNMLKTLGNVPGVSSGPEQHRVDTFLIDPTEALAPTVTVPNVTGLTQSAAATALIAAGLSVGSTSTATSATIPSGSVISQSPTAGSTAATGSAVDLVISIGSVVGALTVPNTTAKAAHTQAPKADALTHQHRGLSLSKGVTEMDLTLYKGARQKVTFTMAPVEDITGWSILATIRKSVKEAPTLAPLVTIAATITNAAGGVFTIEFLAAHTQGLPTGDYSWDVWRTNVGNEEPLMVPSTLSLLRSARVPDAS